MGVEKQADGSFTVACVNDAERAAGAEADRAIAEYMHAIIGDRNHEAVTLDSVNLMHDKIDAAAQAIIDAVNEVRSSCHRQLNDQILVLRRY